MLAQAFLHSDRRHVSDVSTSARKPGTSAPQHCSTAALRFACMLADVHESGRVTPVISSRHHPLVARFREAARGGTGTPLLLDGPHLLLEALGAHIPLLDVAMSADSADTAEMAQIRRRVPSTQIVTAQVMDALSPTRTPAGVVALADRPASREEDLFDGPAPLV